uniref:Uncharacterized protein n=1 Tax=Terrapene triunguis TaxID=2587831 RepID=A0A674JW42_9SAUR
MISSVKSWLLRCWDQGAQAVHLFPGEILMLGALFSDISINQLLRGAQRTAGSRTLLEWIFAAVEHRWPDPMDWDDVDKPWSTIPEASIRLREMGIQVGLYTNNFQGPDHETITAGMRNRFLHTAPLHLNGALLAVLSPAQGCPVGEAALLLGQLGDIEDTKAKVRASWANRKGDAKKEPTCFSRRDFFVALLKSGTPKDKIDRLPTKELVVLNWEMVKDQRKGGKWEAEMPAPPAPRLYPSLDEWQTPAPDRRPAGPTPLG